MDFAAAIESGFVAYSSGDVVTPPVGELVFEQPPGDTHIKYGYIKDDDYFVIKIASGFYQNTAYDLPSGSGLMLVFSQKTGFPETILLDEGYLTNVRTAVAGQISAKYLAPESIHAIGVFGTGTMARMQVQYLRSVTDCRRIVVWGRSGDSLQTYKNDMQDDGYDVQVTRDPAAVTSACNLILMTTPSQVALVHAAQVSPGTHITAMGSDTPEKQELDPGILQHADIVVTDSLEQCQQRGEIHHALKAGRIALDEIIELGKIIEGGKRYRTSNDQITVADLTGVAVQDIQIAKAVCKALGGGAE
ncbi:MAG: ornithine cyclodeaminase family protein [Gammaproteobacteria bacterium]